MAVWANMGLRKGYYMKPPYDICMCLNKECALRDTCKRNPDHYDMRGTIMSYSDLYDGKMCSSYWKLERREKND